MELKEGVNCEGVNPKIWEALWIINGLYKNYNTELVVTSLREGLHSKKRSSHYRGDAADTRIWGFTPDTLYRLVAEIEDKLGEDFVVVLELKRKHIHIHWSPVYHGS